MISGINTGYNLGKGELTTSGTVGAALEAASFEIPTIAISQEVTRDDIKFENGEVDYTEDYYTELEGYTRDDKSATTFYRYKMGNLVIDGYNHVLDKHLSVFYI